MMAMLALCVVGVLFYEWFWLHVGCGVLLGAVWIQSGWIGHDSAHCGLFAYYVLFLSILFECGDCVVRLPYNCQCKERV